MTTETRFRAAVMVLVSVGLVCGFSLPPAAAEHWVYIGNASVIAGYIDGVHNNTDDAYYDSGQVPGSGLSWDSTPQTATGPSGWGQARSTMIVDYGHVRGAATSEGHLTDSEWLSATSIGLTSNIMGICHDTFYLSSPIYPDGTYIPVTFHMWLDGYLKSNLTGPKGGSIMATMTVDGWNMHQVSNENGTGAFSRHVDFVAYYPVGGSFTVEERLDLDAGTYVNGWQYNDAWVQALAENSAGFGIEILDPNVSYTSESGTIYPIPEPCALVLVGSAAAGLVVVSRLRRKKTSGLQPLLQGD